MILWKVLGAIGRSLITAGVIILLFVAYQLWGTGIQEARAQGSLTDEFEELLAEVDLEPVASPTPAPTPTPVTDAAGVPLEVQPTPPPTPTPLPKANIDPERMYREEGEVVGRIRIDSIGVDKAIVEGTNVEPLRLGPGRYSSTVFPGQEGNAAIAGHRTTYGAPFHRVDELVPGDEILVQTIQGVARYEVDAYEDGNGKEVGYFIVDPSATHVLEDKGDNRLTLTACHPKYSAAQRIIVTATLVSDPFPDVDRPDGKEAGDLAFQGPEGETEELISEAVAVDDDPSVTYDADGNIVPVEDVDVAADETGAERDPNDNPVLETDSPDPGAAASVPSDIDQSSGTAAEAEATGVGAAAPEEDPDFGEGLNGDSSAILPSIAWALACAFIWLAAWFVGTKWKAVPMYAVGVLPFAACLWLVFVHVDQAMPSY